MKAITTTVYFSLGLVGFSVSAIQTPTFMYVPGPEFKSLTLSQPYTLHAFSLRVSIFVEADKKNMNKLLKQILCLLRCEVVFSIEGNDMNASWHTRYTRKACWHGRLPVRSISTVPLRENKEQCSSTDTQLLIHLAGFAIWMLDYDLPMTLANT